MVFLKAETRFSGLRRAKFDSHGAECCSSAASERERKHERGTVGGDIFSWTQLLT